MEETQKKSPAVRKKRSWWGWLWRGTLILLLLGILFHRPIIFGLIQFGIGKAEKAGKLRIEYTLHGSIFTNLEITNLRITPTGPGILKKVTLDRARLTYAPLKFFNKSKKFEVLDTLEVKNLLLDLDLTNAPPPKRVRRRADAPKIPSPLPRLLEARGITVRIEQKIGLLEIKNGNLSLLPAGEGAVTVDELTIPNLPVLENLAATTRYWNRDLIVRELRLADDLVIHKAELDASRAAQQMLGISLYAEAFGGPISGTIDFSNLAKTNDMVIDASARGVSFERMGLFFKSAAKLSGMVDQFSLKIVGEADNMPTWNGALLGHVTEPGFGDSHFSELDLNMQIRAGQVRVENARLLRGSQSLALAGTMQLPGRRPDGRPFLANLQLQALFPDLSELGSASVPGGSLTARGTLTASPGRTDAQINLDSEEIALAHGKLTAVHGRFDFNKTGLEKTDKNAPWWRNTRMEGDFATGPMYFGGYQIDRVAAKISSVKEKMTIGPLEVQKGGNYFRAQGGMVFSREKKPAFPGKLDLDFSIDAPQLRDLSIDPADPIIEGRLAGTGSLHMETPSPEISLKLSGSGLEHRGVGLGELAIEADLQEQIAHITNLLLATPDQGWVQATGQYDTRPGAAYAGQVSVNVPDLGRFKVLLGKAWTGKPLAGALQIDWLGSGKWSERQHEGQTAIYLKNGRIQQIEGIELRTEGYYTPKEAHFPSLLLKTSKGDLTAAIEYANRSCWIKSLRLTQQQELRLAGDIVFPLDLEKAASPREILPLDGNVSIHLTGKDVNVGGLQTDIGLKPWVAGLVSLKLDADGPLQNPTLQLDLDARGLRTESVKQLDPADIDLSLQLAERQAVINGSARQPLIQPLSIQGSVPFDTGKFLSTGKLDPAAPLNLAIRLPASSLASLPKFFPVLRDATGTVALDLGIQGTVGQPQFTGGLQTSIQTLRFRSTSLPTFRSINGSAAFRDNILRIDKLSGDLAGGPFQGSGTINLKNPKEPQLDIKLTGQSILFARNDNLIIRSDLDLTLRGPWASAELGGVISITDSRFFREIDILPINLPGRPAPALPGGRPTFSITAAPMRDWKFNVTIQTKDNFLVRGNLANGDITALVYWGGTGLAPTLEGNVEIYNLVGSLPFSRLNIDYGNIYFSRNLPPLSPIVDLRGHSRVRDYNVDVYIWGDALKPSTLFLSQPPLSQEDILTLLATGVTQTELTENPQLLAGRAGILVLQKYYNKLFHRKSTPYKDSPLDRIDIQIGTIDPKTGKENASARVQFNDQWQLVADLDVSGGVRGQLRYLIRFK